MLVFALAGLAVVGPAVSASTRTNVVAPIKISVVTREFSFTFSKNYVRAGSGPGAPFYYWAPFEKCSSCPEY